MAQSVGEAIGRTVEAPDYSDKIADYLLRSEETKNKLDYEEKIRKAKEKDQEFSWVFQQLKYNPDGIDPQLLNTYHQKYLDLGNKLGAAFTNSNSNVQFLTEGGDLIDDYTKLRNDYLNNSKGYSWLRNADKKTLDPEQQRVQDLLLRGDMSSDDKAHMLEIMTDPNGKDPSTRFKLGSVTYKPEDRILGAAPAPNVDWDGEAKNIGTNISKWNLTMLPGKEGNDRAGLLTVVGNQQQADAIGKQLGVDPNTIPTVEKAAGDLIQKYGGLDKAGYIYMRDPSGIGYNNPDNWNENGTINQDNVKKNLTNVVQQKIRDNAKAELEKFPAAARTSVSVNTGDKDKTKFLIAGDFADEELVSTDKNGNAYVSNKNIPEGEKSPVGFAQQSQPLNLKNHTSIPSTNIDVDRLKDAIDPITKKRIKDFKGGNGEVTDLGTIGIDANGDYVDPNSENPHYNVAAAVISFDETEREGLPKKDKNTRVTQASKEAKSSGDVGDDGLIKEGESGKVTKSRVLVPLSSIEGRLTANMTKEQQNDFHAKIFSGYIQPNNQYNNDVKDPSLLQLGKNWNLQATSKSSNEPSGEKKYTISIAGKRFNNISEQSLLAAQSKFGKNSVVIITQ